MKRKLKTILLSIGIPILAIASGLISYFVFEGLASVNLSGVPLVGRFLALTLFQSAFYMYLALPTYFATLSFAVTLKKALFEKEPLRRWTTVAISASVVLIVNLLYSSFAGNGRWSLSTRAELLVSVFLISCAILILVLFYQYRLWRVEKQMSEPSCFKWIPILRVGLFLSGVLWSIYAFDMLCFIIRAFLFIYAVIIGATLKREKKSRLVLLFWTIFTGVALFVSMAMTYTLLEDFGTPMVDYIIEAVFSLIWCPLGYLCAALKSKKKGKSLPAEPIP